MLAKVFKISIKGKRAEVIEEIVPMHTGLIKIGGEIWSAKGLENSKYDVGTIVEVVDIIGCHCIVRLIKDTKKKSILSNIVEEIEKKL
jgi:membrane protein implicated in regulation of membrane protease activity